MKDSKGNAIVGKHRKADLDALLSPEVGRAFGKVNLMNYRSLIAEKGLGTVQRTFTP